MLGGYAQVVAVELAQLGDQIRREEREQQREAREDNSAGDPPCAAERARERHDDRYRGAHEQELSAEREPRVEGVLEHALLRDPVLVLPPDAGEPERKLREPHER